MLDPDSWQEPFSPAMVFSGRRSVIPGDMDSDELALLAEALPFVQPVVLRARVADALWTHQRPRDPTVSVVAVEAYLSAPLTWESWVRSGRDGFRRVIELTRRQGKPGIIVLQRIAHDLYTFLIAGNGDGFMSASVSEVLRKTGQVTSEQASDLGRRLVALASEPPGADRRERALLREAAEWWRRAHEPEESLACQVRIADSYLAEAEERMRGDRGALIASAALEKSLAVLRALPRKFRDARGLDQVLAERQRRLRELRQYSLEEMTAVGSESVDISQWVAQAREHVAGRGRLEAVAQLARITPLTDVAEEMRQARERLSDALSRLVHRSTLSSDARKTSDREGSAGLGPSDDEVIDEVVRTRTHAIGLIVDALILPATATLMVEHRFDMAFFESACAESPTVPVGHGGLWARGLWHGLNGDFPSSVSILVPQVEQFIRAHLKARGVHTLHVGDGGVETEKSLGALLDLDDTATFLGPNLAFELRALLTEQSGPNLRNELAHGLMSDGGSWSAPSVYAWWLCLRMVMAPLAASIDAVVEGSEQPDA